LKEGEEEEGVVSASSEERLGIFLIKKKYMAGERRGRRFWW